MFKIFDASVKPILYYGLQIWRYQYIEKLKKVHIKFCKKICFLSTNTFDYVALGECGRTPLCMTYMPNCIKYWLKSIPMDNKIYPKQCYFMLFQLDESGRRIQATLIKDLILGYGVGHAWIFHDVGNEK